MRVSRKTELTLIFILYISTVLYKGILEVFHQVGVAEAFRQHSQIVEVSKAGGSSAGALVAAAMLTGLPMQSVLAQVVALRGSS